MRPSTKTLTPVTTVAKTVHIERAA